MNKNSRKMKRLLEVLILVLVTFGLAGCMGTAKYTDQQAAETVAKGRPLLEEFLESLPAKDISNVKFTMTPAAQEGSLIWAGPYPANSVTVTFNADGRAYEAIVDLESGVIYSNYYLFDLNEHIARQLKPYCEKYGFTGSYSVRNAMVNYQFYSHDVAVDGKSDRKTNSYVSIENMIPSVFDQEDEIERADAYLKNAPVSDFSIYYEMQDDEPFNPAILTDYLSDTGNYDAVEDGVKPVISSYGLIGKRNFSEFPENGIAGWETYLFYNGDISNMSYSLFRIDACRHDEFCFTYTAAKTTGEAGTGLVKDFEEYRFPVVIEKDRLVYSGDDAYGEVTLRFNEEPKYTFTRVRYENGAARDEEKMSVMQNDDGMWYLTLADRERAYLYSYRFDQAQELMFKD